MPPADDRWDLVELPAGPQPIPSWAKDMAVNWHEGYGNDPSFAIKATEGATGWPDERWGQTGSLFHAIHEDGRALFQSHSGPIAPTVFERIVAPEWGIGSDGKFCRLREKAVVEHYTMLATIQQDGYAGRHFTITMAEGHRFAGQKVVLRGPWFGASLPGYVQVTMVDPRLSQDKFWSKRGHPWHLRGGTFGLFITTDLFLRLFARFLPHLQLARCFHSYLKGEFTLEPMKPEWDAPKSWMMERERAAREAERRVA